LPSGDHPTGASGESRAQTARSCARAPRRLLIQILDATHFVPRWRTVATCSDTPTAIAHALATLTHVELWIVGPDADRKAIRHA
jgi:hypothetical protein